MRLLSIDYKWTFDPAEITTFESLTSCYDFDIVIWDPAGTYKRYGRFGATYQGIPSLSESDTRFLQDATTRRKQQFTDLLKSGKVVIVVGRPPQKLYLDTSERKYSGTGRNRHTTHIVKEFDLWSVIPAEIEVTAAAGERVTAYGSGALQRLIKEFTQELRYQAIIELDGGEAVARITGTDKAVGASLKTPEGGHLVVIPAPAFIDDLTIISEEDEYEEDHDDEESEEGDEVGGEPEDESEDGPHQRAWEFQEAIIQSVAALTTEGGEGLPHWATLLRLNGESELRQRLDGKLQDLTKLTKEVEQLEEELRVVDERKYLVSGYDSKLEIEAKKVFELLGATVYQPEGNRDDLIIYFPEGVAVAEVKGLTKSAAEKNAAQLEKWVSSYIEKHSVTPKALLIANTWRLLPIESREKDDFPSQMLTYSTARSHCLITGLQLLSIHEQLLRSPKDAESIRKLILSTTGALPGFNSITSGPGTP